MALAVRSDSGSVLAGTSGDYIPLTTDSSGNLYVNVRAITPGNSASALGKNVDTAAGATDTGVAVLATRKDTLATHTPADGDYVPLRVNAQGATWVQDAPATTGGCLAYSLISAATNNAQSIKGAAGQVYGIHAHNIGAAVRYLKLYNKATAPAPATDGGLLVKTIPVQPGIPVVIPIPKGLAFAAGVGMALVSGIATNDNTNAVANEVTVNIDYF